MPGKLNFDETSKRNRLQPEKSHVYKKGMKFSGKVARQSNEPGVFRPFIDKFLVPTCGKPLPVFRKIHIQEDNMVRLHEDGVWKKRLMYQI